MTKITPQKLSEMITQRDSEIRRLLQRYRIFAPVSVQTIQQAAAQYGNRFTLELSQILVVPTATQQTRKLAAFEGDTPPATGTGGTGAASSDGNFWNTLSSLFGYAYDIYQDQQNNNGSGSPATPPTQPAATDSIGGIQTKYLLMGMGAIVLILIIVLIVKK